MGEVFYCASSAPLETTQTDARLAIAAIKRGALPCDAREGSGAKFEKLVRLHFGHGGMLRRSLLPLDDCYRVNILVQSDVDSWLSKLTCLYLAAIGLFSGYSLTFGAQLRHTQGGSGNGCTFCL